MRRVCEALGVARSNIAERCRNKGHLQVGEAGRRKRGPYQKGDDRWLLPMIMELVKERPTYGYRRIHALLNRALRSSGRPLVNHKRIYRIMKQNGLLLTRYTGRPLTRAHDGKVITLKSNMRWCSDVFEIPCWNGDRVRVVFSLDCCDREVLSYIATSGWVNAQMVRDLMTQSMEYRFGAVEKLPHKIEWLSDNAKCYVARETIEFAKQIGLIPCTTAFYSPESNGVAEAFVKTFKRDYVYVHDRPDAMTVMAQLPKWFEDYNENHPHKGLKMCSPREFIRRYST